MFKVKSFVKEKSLSVNIMPNGDTDMMTKEPSVLISAKDLYRMIYGRDKSTANQITDFINKIKHVDSLAIYNEALETEIESIKVDLYCMNELENDAFTEGKGNVTHFATGCVPVK